MPPAAASGSTRPAYAPVRHDPYSSIPPDPALPIRFTEAGKRRPRLLATPEELAGLRARLQGSIEAQMFERLRSRTEHFIQKPNLPAPGAPVSDRGFAAGLPELALLHALTGERRYLDTAKAQALALAKCDPASGKDPFSASDMLTALAWSYDWLHEHFTSAERGAFLGFVQAYGTATFGYMANPLGFWSGTPLHNVTLNGWAGVGVAGLGFHDEIEPAREWALAAQRFFRVAAWLQPPDGAGIEGPQYSAYELERKMMHYEAARRCLGEDLYGPGEARSGSWFRHMTTPNPEPKKNAFCWNDNGPYFDAHGPVYFLFAMARRFKDPQTQALALKLWRARIANGLDWINLLQYDPAVPEAPWDDAPTAAHFEDVDMVFARSSWRDDATALSFCCGPYQGHRARRVFVGDPGGSHQHAHTGSFQLCSRGEDLLVDPGYEHIKRTHHHNTILVNGLGQLGEGIKWFNVNRVLHWNGTGEVLSYRDDGQAVAWVGESAKMYVPEAQLERFRRHMLYLRPDLLVIVDELRASEPAVFTQLWHTKAQLQALGGGAWGCTQEHAACTLLPLAVPQDGPASSAGSLRIGHAYQKLPDLSMFKDLPFSELRVESPRVLRWVFATVCACGDARQGPPKMEARATPTTVVVQAGPGAPVSIEFALEDAAPPTLVRNARSS